MKHNRAEGSDIQKNGRVNPSAVFLSEDFHLPANSPTPLDVEELLLRIDEAGIEDASSEISKQVLSHVSFQHVREYLSILPLSTETPRSINEAYKLMKLDREFQLILFEYIGTVELQLRLVYAREMSLRYGAFAHRNPRLFKRRDHFDRFLREYSITFLRIAKGKPCRQKRHIEQYGDMPIWEAVEEMSLGTLSKLYKNTKSPTVRDAVAQSFSCTRDIFESWIGCLTVVRNQIAHFGMLLGRKLPIQPKRMFRADENNTEAFFVVLMLMRMLKSDAYFEEHPELAPSMQLSSKVRELFSHKKSELEIFGIPSDWESTMTNFDPGEAESH